MPSTFNLSAPSTFNLQSATVDDIQKAYSFGALSVEELTQLYLNRITAYDDQGPNLSAVVSVNPDALDKAKELDAKLRNQGADGALYGIPVLLKDNYDTSDLPTTAGSDVLAGSIPPDDAFTTSEFRDAGAIILGKTNMSEFALSSGRLGYSSLGGLTLNPYNLNRDASGSSSGTGAAIAANFATLGTGTDTAGSVRGPSSTTSLVGIKPTRGLVSNDGIVPLALTADVAGPMALSVEDAAIALGVMAGVDANDPATEASQGKSFDDYTQFLDKNALQGARIGVARDYFGGNEEVDSLVEAAIDKMKAAGATIIELDLPDTVVDASNYGTLLNSVVQAEFNPQIEEYLGTLDEEYPQNLEELIAASEDPELVNSETPVNPNRIAVYKDSLEFGGLDNPEYQQAINEGIPQLQEELNNIFASNQLDAIVYPTIATPPTPITDSEGNVIEDPTYQADLDNVGGDPYRANYLANLTGFPDITVPAGYTEQGLPVGISLFGQAFTESTLIGLAYAYEQENPVRIPPSNTPALPGEKFEYLTEVLIVGDAGDDVLETGLIPNFDGNKDVVFAGIGDDLVDTTQSISGGNRVFGGSGDDELFAGKNDVINGGKGDDILDASTGRGGNRLSGGDGDDTFFAGGNDRLIGGSGNDRFFMIEKGGNTISGGAGKDQFWIVNAQLPEEVNTITDFESGVDVIGIAGIDDFEDVSLEMDGKNTVISVLDRDVAVLLGVEGIGESDFALM
jgi:amidase